MVKKLFVFLILAAICNMYAQPKADFSIAAANPSDQASNSVPMEILVAGQQSETIPLLNTNEAMQTATNCPPPVLHTEAINIGTQDATLVWIDPNSGNRLYEVEYGPFGFATGTGTRVTVTGLSYQIPEGTLGRGQIYAYQVRGICAGNVTSDWSVRRMFFTLHAGGLCDDPIIIPSLPYSHESNTLFYNHYQNKDTHCGNVEYQGNYLEALSVVYKYTANHTGNINISMNPLLEDFTGIFVYGSCETIGVNCLASVFNREATIRNIVLNVVTGRDYYIVLSSRDLTFNYKYLLTIEKSGCPAPTRLQGTVTDVSSANISWTAANPVATEWEIGLQDTNINTSIPVSGDDTAYFTSTVTNYAFTGLNMRTHYQYWVREKCPNSNVYSNWAGPFKFTTPICKPEFQCNVTFELKDLSGEGWGNNRMEISQNGFVIATIGESLTGTTAEVTVPICTGIPFSVFWKSTQSIDPTGDVFGEGAFTSAVRLKIKNQFNQVLYESPVNFSSYFNTTIYTGTVHCGSLNCAPPTNLLAAYNPAEGTTFNWSANQTPATRWEIFVGNWDNISDYRNPTYLAQLLPTYSTIGNETTFLGTNALLPNHEYYFIVRPVCLGIPGDWSIPKKFSTFPQGDCHSPTPIVLSDVRQRSFHFDWENDGATAWEVVLQPIYSGEPQEPGIVVYENQYFASGLIPRTAYEFYVRSICGNSVGPWERLRAVTLEGAYDRECKMQFYSGGLDLRQQLIANVYNEVFAQFKARGSVPQGFNPPSLRQLVPFLAVSNPGIYDFRATGAESGYNMVSFSYEANVNPVYPDFKITTTFADGFDGLGPLRDFEVTSESWPYYANQAYLNESGVNTTFENGGGLMWVKKIDFCRDLICTETFSHNSPPYQPHGYWDLETGYWTVFDNGVDQTEEWSHVSSGDAYQGEQSAICKGYVTLEIGQISEEWLVSPIKHIDANEKMRFLTRQGESKEFNTKFEIRVSTSGDPFNKDDYETIKVYTENDLMLNEDTNVPQLHTVYQQKLVDLGAYNGQAIHIAFVKVFESLPDNRRSDDWLIDNVQIVKPCTAVSNIRITNVTPTYFSVTWDTNGSNNWDVQYGPPGFILGQGTIEYNIYDRELMIDGISTDYDIYVRSRCNGCAGYTGSWIKWERCVSPSDMIVTQLSPTSASISWDAGTATSWQIVIRVANTGYPSSEGVTVYEPFYTATNLNPNINYDVFIRSNCNNLSSGFSNMGVIDLVPDAIPSCALSNTNSNYIKHLVLELINDVIAKSQLPGWISQNYTSTYLLALRPYITDANPGIYNFRATPTSIAFDFTQNDHHYVGNSDVRIEATNISGGYVDFDLDMYVNSVQRFGGSLYNENGANGNFYARHINFCPDTLIECLSHVAIVVDESGSISSSERSKIKTQLRNFIEQQAAYNDTHNSNIHISIIGMSDADTNNRMDHVKATASRGKITSNNYNDYISWINNYGTRTNVVSASSDFWNSGLSIALGLTFKPDVVVMITDGAQAEKPETLIRTLKKFNNFRDPQNPENALKPNGPHLYVIGIENGYYIGKDMPGIIMTREEDPNYNESVVSNNKVSTTLTTSLKYLLGYPDEPNMFPLKSIRDFTQDYFGHEDFLLFTDDLTYITDNLRRNNTPRQLIPYICGTESVKDVCDDCYSFKPEPGKEYLLSAWVMEQHNIQVETYKSPKIRLVFYRNNEAVPNDEILDKTVVCVPSGDIIEGWQRIVKKFTIPKSTAPEQNTIVMGIELENSDEGIPVYFDDIRIHPIDGSMKSFVYDPETFKLLSELDENNYATFYEYDNEGGLVRVKKETSRGVKTIQETRSGKVININQN